MTGIGYLAAFLGGVLTLLSPCSALLLPAFFAYAFASRSRLLGRTAVFYADLAGVLVPLGMGSSAASTLVYGHQAALTTTAGVLLIGFGILQVVGGGFHRPRPGPPAGPGPRPVGAVGAGAGGGVWPGRVLCRADPGRGPHRRGRLRSAIARRGAADGLRRGDDRAAVRAGCRLGPAGRRPAAVAARHRRPGGPSALAHPLGDLGADLHRPGRGLPALPGHRRAGRAAGPPSLAGWDNRLQDAVTAIQAHVPYLALLAAAAAVVIAVTAWRLRRARHAAPADRESAGRDPVRER